MEDLYFLAACIVGCLDLPEERRRILQTFLEGKPTPLAFVKETVSKLPTLSQALSIIAQKIGAQSIFERKVLETYFLATENNFPSKAIIEILKATGAREETIFSIPHLLEINPPHNCVVVLSAFPLFFEELNLCFVRPGVVGEKITENVVKLQTVFISQKGKHFCLKEREEYARNFVPVEEEELVAVHCGYIIRRITEHESETLCKGLSLIPLILNKKSS